MCQMFRSCRWSSLTSFFFSVDIFVAGSLDRSMATLFLRHLFSLWEIALNLFFYLFTSHCSEHQCLSPPSKVACSAAKWCICVVRITTAVKRIVALCNGSKYFFSCHQCDRKLRLSLISCHSSCHPYCLSLSRKNKKILPLSLADIKFRDTL